MLETFRLNTKECAGRLYQVTTRLKFRMDCGPSMRWLVLSSMLLLGLVVSVPVALAQESAEQPLGAEPEAADLAAEVWSEPTSVASDTEVSAVMDATGAPDSVADEQVPIGAGSASPAMGLQEQVTLPVDACGATNVRATGLGIAGPSVCNGFVKYEAPVVEAMLAGPDSLAMPPPVDAKASTPESATEDEVVNPTEEHQGLNHTEEHQGFILDPPSTPPGPQAIDRDGDWKPTSTATFSPTSKSFQMASAFAATAVLALLMANFGRILRFLAGMPATALFSRVNRNKALAHPPRQDLLEVIKSHAGITLPELTERLGMSRNNATYHLDVLERNGLVVSRLIGRCRFFFASNGSESSKVAVLRNHRRRLIGEYVLVNPACIQRDICRDLGIPASRVHAQVKQLIAAGLLVAQAGGRALHLEATEDLRNIVATLRAADSMQAAEVSQSSAGFDSAGPS